MLPPFLASRLSQNLTTVEVFMPYAEN